jgi:hypothetical protein
MYLALAALAVCSCEQEGIRIGILGDQFGSYSSENSYSIMQQGAEELSELSPDIVLHVGDMVESVQGISGFDDYRAAFVKALSIMDRFDCPWLLAVGDHDVVPPDYRPLSGDRSREQWFMDLIQGTSLPLEGKPYYSYDHQGYHFIVLYSLEMLHTDPRWGSIFLNKISREQLAWLKEDLHNSRRSKGVVVLVHHPHWYVWQNWQPVHELLKAYKTRAVIAGHYHYDQDEGLIDGIRYLVMGSSGGVIKETDIHSGTQEIGLLQIDPHGITEMKLFEIGSGREVEWTPRVSMDRMQALSCMLDNLWDEIRVYSDGNKLLLKDPDGAFRTLEHVSLSTLSNPLDLPLHIRISPENDFYSDSYWLLDGDTLREAELTLQPGQRSGWANYSTVGNWYPLPVIWMAEMRQSDAAVPDLQFRISLRIEDTRVRELNKTLNYTIKKKEL